jgi:hypothetical protein
MDGFGAMSNNSLKYVGNKRSLASESFEKRRLLMFLITRISTPVD